VPPPHARCALQVTLPRHSFSRSYGVNLPSSLTRDTSRLRILSSPTCVGFGYGFLGDSLEAFLGSVGTPTLCPNGLAIAARGCVAAGIYHRRPPTSLHRHVQPPAGLPFCVPPSLKRPRGSTGILTRCPSPTPHGLSLGADSPWVENLAQEPLGFRRGGFTPP
jgi:hypothetical protein